MSRFLPGIGGLGVGGGGGGGGGVDHFAPGIIVGNQLEGDPAAAQAAPFEYYGDPGDGTEIVAALASAAARGVDVYIRPGTYTIAAANLPLVISGFRVCGAGGRSTTIVGSDTERRVFVSSVADSVVRDIFVSMPNAAVGASGASCVDLGGVRNSVELVTVSFPSPVAQQANESLTSVFRIGTSSRIHESRSLLTPRNGGAVVAIRGAGDGAIIDRVLVSGSDVCVRLDNRGAILSNSHLFPQFDGGSDGILVNNEHCCVSNVQLRGLAAGSGAGTGITVAGDHAQVLGSFIENFAEGVVVSGDFGVVSNNNMRTISGDEIRIEAAAADTRVIANGLGGGAINNLSATSEIAHNV